jgi:hypothetical protein
MIAHVPREHLYHLVWRLVCELGSSPGFSHSNDAQAGLAQKQSMRDLGLFRTLRWARTRSARGHTEGLVLGLSPEDVRDVVAALWLPGK